MKKIDRKCHAFKEKGDGAEKHNAPLFHFLHYSHLSLTLTYHQPFLN